MVFERKEKKPVMKFKPSQVIEQTEKGNKLLKDWQGNYIVTTANGKHWCLIDKDDWDLIKNHYWAECDKGYLRTTITIDGRQTWRRMHTLILPNGHQGMVVDHENRKKWDNRKDNLVLKTIRDNFLNSDYWDEKFAKVRERHILEQIKEDILADESMWVTEEV